jgi:hypothetical protein
VVVYYQTTSREYMEFLRDEINGTADTLKLDPGTGLNPAGGTETYIIQTDAFFSQLRAWGDTIWQLWQHNMNVPGAAPYAMTQATVGNVGGGCEAPLPTLLSAQPGNGEVSLSWSDEHTGNANVVGYNLYYDQAGKAQLVASLGLVTTYTDTGLSNGVEYCYKVTSRYADCESEYSNILCATPSPGQTGAAGVSTLTTGIYNGATFVETTTFTAGDAVVVRAIVVDTGTGLPLQGATVSIAITGPESQNLSSGASTADGIAEATWQTKAPNARGKGGTKLGTYTATVTDVAVTGYTWDGVATTTSFDIQ